MFENIHNADVNPIGKSLSVRLEYAKSQLLRFTQQRAIILLPRHSFEVWISVHICDANALRFVQLFRRVWQIIPLRHRRIILKHWLNGKTVTPVYVRRQSHLVNGDHCAIGLNDCDGLRSQFSNVIFEMDDACAMALIAHELAHTLQHADGVFEQELKIQCGDWNKAKIFIENDANNRASLWGLGALPIEQYWKAKRGVGKCQ